MKYAVIRIGGQQFKVEEGDEILVGKLKDLKKIDPEVLLTVDGESVKVGKPTVKGAKVSLKVISELVKGKKMEIYKFKAKSRYKRHTGFRPQYTSLQVGKITA
ncbi:MAG TPA: 50S ribosomal protein L21 [Patescibacteria group bacterium]|nr:50S ribosomal protein L21 [Patescibacteria group bacterium]